MKRLITVLLAVVISITSFSQDKRQHLVFKGIPIDGDYNVFAQKLVQKGFKIVESTQDGVVLKGTFMATANVMVSVHPDPKTKKVSSVMAFLEAGDNWPTIENNYETVIEFYKEKYGEPNKHVEEFTIDVHDNDLVRKHA